MSDFNNNEQIICYTELPKDRTIENFVIMFWQLCGIIEKIQSNQSTNFEIISSLVKRFGKINEDSNIFHNRCTTLLNTQVDTVDNLSNVINGLLNAYISKEEIAEIVNKAISSYIKNIEGLNEQNIEEIRKKIDEANKQNNKEIGVYQTQIIQMFKDLTNKVDKLESIIISQKKEMTDVATQTFANGLCSSNKKVYTENILKKDLESQNNVSTNNKKLGNKKENNGTPSHTSEVSDTILEDITSEKSQQPLTRQVVIDGSSVDKTRVVNEENKNIDNPKVNESHEKLDLETIMRTSRKTTITKYKEKVGNDYAKEKFKNNKEIGIGCKHRAFLRFDGGMMKLSGDVFEKDTKLEKNTYYFEREGQKYLVFRNIDSANVDVPNDSFTLMKLPEGCKKFDNDIIVDILNKARIDGIDGENSILIDSIEELQGLVVTDEKTKNKYFDEAKNRRVCSLLSNGDLMKTYTGEFEKGCKENEITNYNDYMPLNDEQLEFRSEKEIGNGMYVKPYVKKVNELPSISAMQEKKKVESESLLGLQATPTKTEQLSQLKDISETFYDLENNNQEIDLIF